MTKFGYNIIQRLCTSCGKQKPVRGGTTYPRFRCADCHPKRKNRENKPDHS